MELRVARALLRSPGACVLQHTKRCLRVACAAERIQLSLLLFPMRANINSSCAPLYAT